MTDMRMYDKNLHFRPFFLYVLNRLSGLWGTSLGDFVLAPVCLIEKIALWVGLLYLMS